MKKNFFRSWLILVGTFGIMVTSCNKSSLIELNDNPNATEVIEPNLMFTGAILDMPAWSYSVLSQGMRYFSSYKEVPAIGDKYYSFTGTQVDFQGFYTTKLNRLIQIESAIQGADDINKRSIVRILKAYQFNLLTDLVGDVPYSDALAGRGNLTPKYDTQKDIYLSLFNELDEAAADLDASKPSFGAADLIFKGNIDQWKKFAYSLMLRWGMRLTKVDADLAETWVKKAIAGGVLGDDDIAKINYADMAGSQNPIVRDWLDGNYINPGGDNVEGGKYTSQLINYLKDTRDPRLAIISVVWVPTAPGASTYTADTTFALQKGMVPGSLNTKPTDFDTYSEPSQLVLNVAAPIIIMGPSETYLLLAEAALRGWYSGMTAKDAYEAGVRAGMKQWSYFPAVSPNPNVVSDQRINEYLVENPYNSGAGFNDQLNQISTQKWLTLFENDYEIYANWRRTGYPVMFPTNYPGNVTGGQMFRRFYIPNSERLTNQQNYTEALQRQGFAELTEDNLLTRLWWDKQ